METRAHFVLIGAFAMGVVAAAAVFVVWLAQVRFAQEFTEYDVVFNGAVRGLSPSSEVRFNGIRVGEVTTLGLGDMNVGQVVARIRVDAATPVSVESVAQLEPQGITGLAYVQINSGDPDAPPLLPKPGEDVAQIPSQAAALDVLFEGGGDVVASANKALARVNALLDRENLARVRRILTNLETVSAQASAHADLFADARAAVQQLESAATRIDEAAVELTGMVRATERIISGEVSPLVARADDAAAGVAAAAEDAQALMTLLEGPLARFSSEGLDNLSLAADDVRRLTEVLERIALDIERDPAQFLVGDARYEVEVTP